MKRGLLYLLAWIGGATLLIWIWQSVTSMEFLRLVIWPFAMVANAANIQPQDISNEAMVIGLMIGGIVVGLLVAGIIIGVEKLQKRNVH